MVQKPDKIGQELRIIVHQSQNNTPFIKNNRYEVQTMDLQWIFKNEERRGRSHPLTLLLTFTLSCTPSHTGNRKSYVKSSNNNVYYIELFLS